MRRSRGVEKKSGQPDWVLAVITGLILVFGLIMLNSASVAVGIARFGDSGYFIKQQFISLLLGVAAFYVAYKLPYQIWKKAALGLLIATIVLLVAVLIPEIGISGKGAQRWLNLGFATLQPSELVKLTLILYLAAWLSEKSREQIQNFYTGFLPFLALLGLLAILIYLQPDLGTLLLIGGIGIAVYLIGGADTRYVSALVAACVILATIAILVTPFRMGRITAFVNPEADLLGVGYHVNQAKLAIGSGGIFGLGLGHSRQKFLYLPEVTGDSLYAVIAEELGILASLAVVILFLLFFWRAFLIAGQTSDVFGKLTAAGIGIWITGQAFINIGAMLGVVPLTGLPLPLMSYGGSALIASLAGIGILLNISKQATFSR